MAAASSDGVDWDFVDRGLGEAFPADWERSLTATDDEMRFTVLHCCAMGADNIEGTPVTSHLLERGGMKILNARSLWSETPLMIAAMYKADLVCERLIKAGARLDLTDSYGRSLRQLAKLPMGSKSPQLHERTVAVIERALATQKPTMSDEHRRTLCKILEGLDERLQDMESVADVARMERSIMRVLERGEFALGYALQGDCLVARQEIQTEGTAFRGSNPKQLDTLRQAYALFQKAIALDPRCAAFWARLLTKKLVAGAYAEVYELGQVALHCALFTGDPWRTELQRLVTSLKARKRMAVSDDQMRAILGMPAWMKPPPRLDHAWLVTLPEEGSLPVVANRYRVMGQPQCWTCGAATAAGGADLKRCSSCRLARYCSVGCQTSHWKSVHKAECRHPPVLDLYKERERWPELRDDLAAQVTGPDGTPISESRRGLLSTLLSTYATVKAHAPPTPEADKDDWERELDELVSRAMPKPVDPSTTRQPRAPRSSKRPSKAKAKASAGAGASCSK